MGKKKYVKKANKVVEYNIFDLGGTIGNIGGAAATIAEASMANDKIADTSRFENAIQTAKSNKVEASTLDDLMNEWSTYSPLENVSFKDIRGGSTGQRLLNTLKATTSGASAGASLGKGAGSIAGGIIGGVVGLGSSIAGWLTGDSKARKKTKDLNAQIAEANMLNEASLLNKADALDTQADLNILSNLMANGGKIYINPSKRGTFTAAAKRHGKSVQAFASQVLANKEDYSPATVKKANFAKNASKWHHAFGGNLSTNGADWDNGIIMIGNGGTHEENPMEGVQIGVSPQGIPNLVEEGEVIFNDYVFSNRLKADSGLLESVNLPKSYNNHSFATIAEKLSKESEERPNDPISQRGLMDSMMKLQQAQETVRQKKQASQEGRKYAYGGKKGKLYSDGGKTSWLRYAPAVGNVLGVLQNVFSKPDYTSADTILDAANSASNYTPAGFTPLGNYLEYKPFDRNYYTNKLNAQAGATRRAIMSTTSPSRNAALLAADYNTQNALGDLYRQAEEYNLAQKQQVESFNRATNQANAEMGLKAAMANQDAALKAGNIRLQGTAQAMAMRNAIDAARASSLSANMSNLFESLGGIGEDAYNRADRDMLIKSGIFGTLSQKPQGWSDKRWQDYQNIVSGTGYAKGGKLRKKRGGFTY